MSREREYEEMYGRLLSEVSTLHENNRRRIRNGMRMLVAVTFGLMLLMFLAEGNKVFTLMLWILSMFAVAAYLIAVEYADYELQKKLEYLTQMEQESMGRLLELPQLLEIPKVGRLLLRHEQEDEPEPDITVEPKDTIETKEPTEQNEQQEPNLTKIPEPISFEEYFNDDIPIEDFLDWKQPAKEQPPKEPSSSLDNDALHRLLSDPAQLAADLEALTLALQGLSSTLRRSADETRKEDSR